MARPRKPRRVAFLPGTTYFKPQGIPLRLLEEVRISVEELEALRLKDLEGLEQEEAARQMGVSRQTFQRILEEAHHKATEGLVKGKALRIEGGDYELAPRRFHCRRCGHGWEQIHTHGDRLACPTCEEEFLESAPATPTGRDTRGHYRRARAANGRGQQGGGLLPRPATDG